jgi:uncharacterized membrane protein
MAETFSTGRLEAFSDGVIAVIITIMVLELKVPAERGFAGLRAIAPVLAVYALSFTFVGIYWINHHVLLDRIRQSTPRILRINLVWMFFLSLLPFFTAYVLNQQEDSSSVALYAASLFCTGLAFMWLRLAVNAQQQEEGRFAPGDSALQHKHWISLGAYVAAVPLAYRWPVLALCFVGLVTLHWIVPTLGAERLHRHPADKADTR